MEIKNRALLVIAISMTFSLTTFCAGGKDPSPVAIEDSTKNNNNNGGNNGGGSSTNDLPTPGSVIAYEESSVNRPYRPILVSYSSSGTPPISSWKSANTRLLHYMEGYKPSVLTNDDYKAITNKYGSSTTGERYDATGRFYVKKIGERWWIIDPDGYPYYMRGFASFRPGESTRNKTAWNQRFGTNDKWISTSQAELAEVGFHQAGAFGTSNTSKTTGTYTLTDNFNSANPATPIVQSPSFGFLSQFKSKYSLSYPDGNSSNAIAFVLDSRWDAFCESYMRSTAFTDYVGVGNKNIFGFFSDNEIDISSLNSRILDRFLALTDKSNIAYTTAKSFMDSKGTTKVTDQLNSDFAGMLAEKYYKAIRQAKDKVDPGLLYLGSRLHGTPKYIEGVIRAAGKYCDIISINYYSRWSVEGKTAVADWARWADCPFVVTEFYTKGADSDLNNRSGAGYFVPTQKERAYAYQHFTLGLLEAKNCVGWYWFKYQDDDTDSPLSVDVSNKGIYDNNYQLYLYLTKLMQELNFNVYNIVDYFDKQK